ncbi:MAG: doxx family protein [Saprospiraceae bacterium]|nr:doxx family protein [Saprospiraceae bacterium]
MSPAEDIGTTTVSQLCLGFFPDGFCIIALASLEVFIGLSLITRKFYKAGIVLAIGHLIMTFSPMILFPNLTFNDSLFSPSLLGQYIFKNIILIMALIVLYPSKGQRQTI